MKKLNSLLKLSLVGLFLTLTTTVFGQANPAPVTPVVTSANLNVGTIDDNQTSVVADANAVIFLNPGAGGSSITLTASLTDGSTPAITFDTYAWYLVDNAGAISGASLGTTQSITRSGAQLGPGYHRFRVFGLVTVGAANCQSEEYQDIIIFVLNPLNPTAAPVATIQDFCIGETGTFNLKADVTFAGAYQNTGFANPAVTAMNMTYSWYAVKDGDAANPISLGTSTTASGATNTKTVNFSDLTAAGTYTFYVDVEYSNAIKDKATRAVGHGFWRANVMNGATAQTVVVSPKPGRPTITIGTVVD